MTKGDKSAKLWNQAILDSIDQKTDVVLMSMNHWMDGTKIDINPSEISVINWA